jgi:hypothetical protein
MDHTVSWELQSISRMSNTFQHNYRYPADRVSPYRSFKSRQGSGRASMRYHVPYSFGPHLPAEVVSDAVTCPAALNLSSLPMWAPTPSRVPRPRTSPLCRGGLQRFHMSLSFGSRFLPRWAPTLPHVLWLRCCHVFHSPQRVMDHKNKERLSCPRHAGRLTCFRDQYPHYQGKPSSWACKTCGR